MACVHTVAFLLLFQSSLVFHSALAVSDHTDPDNLPMTSGDCLLECQQDNVVTCIEYGLTAIPTGPDCKRATMLVLTANDIRELRPGDFAGFNQLESLTLTNNKIGDIPLGVLSDLGNLETLFVDKNNLTRLQEDVFEGLVNLRDRLIITGNQITRITTGVFETLTLTPILSVDDNHIVSIQPGAFKGMAELSHLYLRGNRISSISSGTFSGLGKLKVLDLSDNRIETLEIGAFEGLVNLLKLELNSNRITSVAAIENLPQLSLLALAQNDIESLGDNRFLQNKLKEEGFTVTFQGNPLRCSCSVEFLRLWYSEHETTEEENAICASPDDYAGTSLADIQAPLLCKQPAVATTSYPLMDARNPDDSVPLLSTPLSIVVTIVSVGLIVLVVGAYLVWKRHRQNMMAPREAKTDDEALDPTPDDPIQARGYSTFVTPDRGADEDSFISQTTAPHPPPNANGHIFHVSEQEETSPFLSSHIHYLPTDELNCPPSEPRVPSTVAPSPPVTSPVCSLGNKNSPVSSLEPDVVCRVDFDERGSVVITTPREELDADSLDGDGLYQCHMRRLNMPILNHEPVLSSLRPCNGGYIAPRNLVGYST